jgi:hypothetical protein
LKLFTGIDIVIGIQVPTEIEQKVKIASPSDSSNFEQKIYFEKLLVQVFTSEKD